MKRYQMWDYGHIGIAGMFKDELTDDDTLNVDYPLDHDFNLSKDEIIRLQSKITLGMETFIDELEEVERRAIEYYKLEKMVTADMKKLNSKYIGNEFIEFNMSSNLTDTVVFIRQSTYKVSQWAVLCVDDIERFEHFTKIVEEFHDIVFLEYVKEHFNTLKWLQYIDFGREARDGYSMFDRSVHHYKTLFKNKEI